MRSVVLRTATFLGLGCVLSATAAAHPGHGEPGATHYLTDPVRVLPVLVAAMLLATIVVVATRARKRVR